MMSTIDDVMRLPISDEAKEYYRQNKVFFDSGWTESLNKPSVSDLLSIAELQWYGILSLSIEPYSCVPTEDDVAKISRPEEYQAYRTFIPPKTIQEIILGVEMIGEWLKKLQSSTGCQVESVTFQQSECIDVVIPTEIKFYEQNHPSRPMKYLLGPLQYPKDTENGKN